MSAKKKKSGSACKGCMCVSFGLFSLVVSDTVTDLILNLLFLTCFLLSLKNFRIFSFFVLSD